MTDAIEGWMPQDRTFDELSLQEAWDWLMHLQLDDAMAELGPHFDAWLELPGRKAAYLHALTLWRGLEAGSPDDQVIVGDGS